MRAVVRERCPETTHVRSAPAPRMATQECGALPGVMWMMKGVRQEEMRMQWNRMIEQGTRRSEKAKVCWREVER